MHRDVEITWDYAPEDNNAFGFAVYLKWQGDTNAPNLCLHWSSKTSEYITSYRDRAAAAHNTANNESKYVYKVYPLNDTVPVTPTENGCDDQKPTSVPFASVTDTLTVDTTIMANSDGEVEYTNPPTPSGIMLEARLASNGTKNSLNKSVVM